MASIVLKTPHNLTRCRLLLKYANCQKVSQRRLYCTGRRQCCTSGRMYIIPSKCANGNRKRFWLESRSFHLSSNLYESIHILKVPAFADSVSEGDVRWEKAVGDSVAIDEVICEIETDKTAVPVPSPVNGILQERYVEDGQSVKAGEELGKIQATEGGVQPPKESASTSSESPTTSPTPAMPQSTVSTSSGSSPKIQPVTPSQEAVTIPISPISSPSPPQMPPQQPTAIKPGSMPVAAIKHAQSLEATTINVPPQDPTSEMAGTRTEHRVKMNRMRLRISQRLKDAQNTTAMLTTFNEIDMSNIMAFRKANLEAFQKKHGLKLSFMSAFLKAAAYGLQEQPVINAVIDGNEIVYRDYVDISVAVATPKGLVVPVVRNVQSMNYADIEKSIADLAEKARKGNLAIEDMDGGTFTVSNGGVFGSLMGTPIINPPQSAILGMHGTFERPIALNGQVVIRPMMYVALTYDHRLIDGREAVLFLRKIKAGVENPTVIIAGL